MSIDLAKLLRHEDIGYALGILCDLEIQDDPREPLWLTVDGSSDFTIIAHDGAGGRFITVGSSPRVIFADSEGGTGVVGRDVDEFVTLVVMCPYWRDLLSCSAGGKLEEMRRAYPVMEAYWRDCEEDNETFREDLAAAIGIKAPDDVVGALHCNVSTRMVFAHAQDGSAMPSLFGNGTIDRNPMLKPYID